MSDSMKVARLMREALERAVATDVASAILFEALGESGIPASNRDAMLGFVDGPLRSALLRRLGEAEGSGLFAMVRMPIENATRIGAKRREETPTRLARPIGQQPRAVVFDDGTGLGRRLLASFGMERMLIEIVRDGSEIASSTASLVIVDAATSVGLDPMSIAKACVRFGPDALRIVHGAETPFGARVVEAFGATNQAAVPVRLDHGAAPLVELIRSRLP